jgi:hypothetical protein
MFRIFLASIVLTISTGCSITKDVLVHGSKGAHGGSTTTYATTHCTVENADGERCDVKTCKADQVSDCSGFAAGCIRYGHNYSGDSNNGTCTRTEGTAT